MRSRRSALALSVVGPWACAAACFASGEGVLPPLHRTVPDAGPPAALELDAAPPVSGDGSLPPLLPHSVRSVDPAHGPFTGGVRAIVYGTGFTSAARVWFGATEVPAADVVPVDPEHVQVTVPAGHAGPTDVLSQNGKDESTLSVLHQGYVYDSFYVDPSSGPLAGGTIITLHGDGTSWDSATKVYVDTSECEQVALRSPAGKPQELDCRTPPGTPGQKRVSVVTDAGTEDVLDGFTYGDSENGFRGGLSGDPLNGDLKVITLNSVSGTALPTAVVIIGSDVGKDSVKTADANGVVLVSDPRLGKTVTVTVAAHCYMPTTFVDVPVDTVTAYLDPILSPECIPENHGGTIVGPGGGSTSLGATVTGELVFPSTIEFRRGPWNVPVPNAPDGSEVHRVAYVFSLSRDMSQPLRLPPKSQGVTEDDAGRLGYKFSYDAGIGNLTLYALAGIEDGATREFTAYSMGIAPGVVTNPGATVADVFVRMNIPLDHAMTFMVDGPKPTSRGPDRVESKVGVRVGTQGYALLPISTQSSLLPATSPLSFVGLPPLVEGLAGAEYVTSTNAFTGESHSPPRSVLGSIATTTTSAIQTVSGFLEVPQLDVPGPNGAWNGQDLALSFAPGGPAEDLTLFEIQSNGGLSTWLVAAPKGVSAVRLPDLSQVATLSAPTGPVSIDVTRIKIDGFVYGSARYGDLTSGNWATYSNDVFQAHH